MNYTAVEDLSLLATFQSGFPLPLFHPHIAADATGGREANEIIQAVSFYTAVVGIDKWCKSLSFNHTNKQQLNVNILKHFSL